MTVAVQKSHQILYRSRWVMVVEIHCQHVLFNQILSVVIYVHIDAYHFEWRRYEHSAMTRPSENVLALIELYHTLAIATSEFLTGKILHWAPYTWHWHVWVTHEHAYMHWQEDRYQLWSDCFMRWMPVAKQRTQILRDVPIHLNV